MNRMHIAIAFDDNYLQPFYALITSIFINNNGQPITLHCITHNISIQEKQRIEKYLHQNNGVICFYSVDREQVDRFVTANHWTTSVYYKIFFPLLVSNEVERLLYIDTDTIVINSLKPLYQDIDLHTYPLAAVYDNYVKIQPELGITEEGHYFNSGVMLINLVEWRKQEISEKAIAFLQEHPEKIRYVDQDALNAVLRNNWLPLDSRFNLIYSYIPEGMSRKQCDRFLRDKVIIHFTLQRPWSLVCKNRYRYLYAQYLRKSAGRNTSVIMDYSLLKIPAYLRILLNEFYLDTPWLRIVWRRLKFQRKSIRTRTLSYR